MSRKPLPSSILTLRTNPPLEEVGRFNEVSIAGIPAIQLLQWRKSGSANLQSSRPARRAVFRLRCDLAGHCVTWARQPAGRGDGSVRSYLGKTRKTLQKTPETRADT
jgi:hypothetical protein